MSILSIWKSDPKLLAEKSVKQIIAISGDGKLRDSSSTSEEFRALISEIPSALLARYTDDCLQEAFTDSGLALQDLINEVGRRLGFKVINGRYRGKQGAIGNDGLWLLPNGHHLIIEVKTTDAYRIDLEIITDYRKKLIHDGLATEDKSSVLIVVGRSDTGDLEAQIRGSRNAWDMRLISIDALLQLMMLRESIEDPDALRRIYEILIPREFTRLDEIVDLVFSTAEDAKKAEEVLQDTDDEEAESMGASRQGSKFTPVAFNELVADRVAHHLGVPLLKRTRAQFSSPDDKTKVLCVVSRDYSKDETHHKGYWFAFHPHQRDLLTKADAGYVAFGCGSAEKVILVPVVDLSTWLDGMNQTIKAERSYWHVSISEQEGRLLLVRKKGYPKIDLSQYAMPTG